MLPELPILCHRDVKKKVHKERSDEKFNGAFRKLVVELLANRINHTHYSNNKLDALYNTKLSGKLDVLKKKDWNKIYEVCVIGERKKDISFNEFNPYMYQIEELEPVGNFNVKDINDHRAFIINCNTPHDVSSRIPYICAVMKHREYESAFGFKPFHK